MELKAWTPTKPAKKTKELSMSSNEPKAQRWVPSHSFDFIGPHSISHALIQCVMCLVHIH